LAKAITNAGQKKNNDKYSAANAKREQVKRKDNEKRCQR